MSDQEKIIERIRRLLSMAEDASSPNEAMIAAKRARMLMDKHQISKTDIEKLANRQFLEAEAGRSTSKRMGWILDIQIAVAMMNDCESLSTGAPHVRYLFQGFKGDAIVAKLTFDYLLEVCEKACANSNTYGVSEKNCFRLGFAEAILKRARQIVAERQELKTSSGTGLIVFKQAAIVAHFGDYPSLKRSRSREMDSSEMRSFMSGYEKGQNVGLDRQVENEKPECALLA